ncbi:MAG: Asp-tRNA(Asn)/Glu-tRNA(Gln) amidotransferase subunit GatC [Candidatus Acetothermia bacterium]|jgi:aspartyl-tRNA(Asn)/glutamyl-tRNA(Gln) amidotransferase subunit C|nr:Asp-tRNA(Asn)/Glu-tRNA(Gln) amidotransferase subunit GatC [Candidatus Acetothermia bacterium]MDH7505658.1 Asp-tRNA(Asn)/Glu-tRNA(Gln) amidotransferase subunit GatC [Candidatus Acetothermia bacterium]
MITREEVLHIAKLAKLKLTEEEVELFRAQLGEILDYFRKLEEVDTEGVELLKHVLSRGSPFREDQPRESVPPEEALKNAPKRRGDYFEVPKAFAH